MGLSETKRKTRLIGSAVTKNSAWTNDASLPGQRLLSSMGWSQGQGLGTSSQGTAVPITMAFKMDNKGIGARRFEKEARSQGKADAWIGGGGELGDLFARLNKGSDASASPSPGPVEPVKEEDEKERRHKKSKRDKGDTDKEKSRKKKDKKGKGKEEGEAEEEADPVVVEEAVRKVASTLPHRMAHRARFLRAKRLVGNDLASVNEILGIASPAASSSPAPADDKTDITSVVGKGNTTEAYHGESEDKMGKRKREDENLDAEPSDKKARKEAKRIAKELKKEKRERKRKAKEGGEEALDGDGEEAPLTVPMEPSSDPSFKAGGGMQVSTMSVQDYLQNKLMKRRAALIRQKREEEANFWKRTAAVGAV